MVNQFIKLSNIVINPEYLKLVPRMNAGDDKVFDDSIKQNGIREPVTINDEDVLLNGHSRVGKAQKYYDITTKQIEKTEKTIMELKQAIDDSTEDNKVKKIKDELADYRTQLSELKEKQKLYENIPFNEKRFDDPLLEKRYVVVCNLEQRHLTTFQKVEIGMTLIEIEKELALQRRNKNLKQNQVNEISEDSIESGEHVGKSTEIAAKQVGVSNTTMMRGQKILRDAPEDIKQKLRENKLSVNSAYNHITRKERNLPTTQLPDGVWSVVMVDLPIQFDNTSVRGSSTNNYDTLSLSDCQLGIFGSKDVRTLFADDCIMFAWFQASTIFYAKPILESWGFECVTNIVWNKERLGTGTWLENQHEHLVIARKGSIPIPSKRVPSIINEKPNNKTHSSKPVKFYDIIESMYPSRQYLDLFSRYKHNDSWTCFGNQLGDEIV